MVYHFQMEKYMLYKKYGLDTLQVCVSRTTIRLCAGVYSSPNNVNMT